VLISNVHSAFHASTHITSCVGTHAKQKPEEPNAEILTHDVLPKKLFSKRERKVANRGRQEAVPWEDPQPAKKGGTGCMSSCLRVKKPEPD